MNDTDIIGQLNELTEKLDQLKSQIQVDMRSRQLTLQKCDATRIKLSRWSARDVRRDVFMSISERDLYSRESCHRFNIMCGLLSIDYVHITKNDYGYLSQIGLEPGRISSHAHRSPISWSIGGPVQGVYEFAYWLHIMLKKPKSEIDIGIKKNAFCILRNKDRKPLTMGKKERDKPF
ncbi:MAG: hypothetical protein ACYC1M_13190 [Armatimonadota bacterium]